MSNKNTGLLLVGALALMGMSKTGSSIFTPLNPVSDIPVAVIPLEPTIKVGTVVQVGKTYVYVGGSSDLRGQLVVVARVIDSQHGVFGVMRVNPSGYNPTAEMQVSQEDLAVVV